MTKLSRYFVLLVFLLSFSACSNSEEDKPLPGKRISVLTHRTELSASPDQEKIQVKLPKEVDNVIWPLQNTAPVQHPAFSSAITGEKSIKAGEKADGDLQLTSTPVIGNGMIYILDGQGVLTARKLDNPVEVVWSIILEIKDTEREIIGVRLGKTKRKFLGGNISFGRSAVFVTTGRGEVMAFGATSGQLLWQRTVTLPVRSPPVIHQRGILFLITSDNKLYALNSRTGKTMWTHEGISEVTSVYGAAGPAVKDNIVIVPYSSGEIYALNVDTGEVIWSDNLVSGSRRGSTTITLNDISATPVIQDDTVYAASLDGILAAYDLASGKRKWSQDITTAKTPWPAGDFLYVLTADSELVCIHSPSGKIKWITPLERKDGDNRISWSAPVLAGRKIIISGSHGKMMRISPYNGDIEKSVSIEEYTYLPPVIANKTIYLLNNEAKLNIIW